MTTLSEIPEVCIHKTPGAVKTRVGYSCPDCFAIRHRHSRIELVEFANIGGISLQHSIVVPIGEVSGDE